MRNLKLARMVGLGPLAWTLLTPASAYAQEDVETAAPGGDTGAIVVTARRVEERLQDVPISITVFNQEEIASRNIVSAGDLAIYTPSLSANSRFGSENTSFAIRGFTQDNGTAPSVGVYFADVPALRAGGGTTLGNGAGVGSLFDLQNVQVLKGPQGTLFGRNTTGGAVLLVPKKPTGDLEGYVEGSLGNYDMRRFQAVLNLPLADTFRVRLGVDRQTRDGYLHNQSPIGPKDFADVDYWAFRLGIVGELTPDLENYFLATYSDSDTNGFLPRMITCNSRLATAPVQLACNQVARQNARGDSLYDVENMTIVPRQHIRQWQVINTTTWKASDALTIKNIASYGEFRQYFRASIYGEYLLLTSGPNAGKPWIRAQTSPYPGYDNASQWTFTEELQFQGEAGDKLNWQAGAYTEQSGPNQHYGTQNPSNAVCSDLDTLHCVSAGQAGLPAASAAARLYDTSFQNYGLYAQGTYRLSDQFSITAGARWTWDRTESTGRHINYASLPITTIPATGTCLDVLSFGRPGTGSNVTRTIDSCASTFVQSSNKPTWMIDLEYKPVDDVLLYAKYARGYRAGGVKSDASGLEVFNPEKVDTYELGLKSSFRGSVSGTFNLAGFYNAFTDQQLSAGAPYAGTFAGLSPAQIIVNAGKSRIWGIEAEATIKPFEGFTLQASYAYLNTKLNSFVAPAIDTSIFAQLNLVSGRVGYPLVLSPENKLTVTGTYVLPLDESIGEISLGATYTYIDENYSTLNDTEFFLTGVTNRDLGLLPAVNLINLNVNWKSVGGLPLDLSAFVTNLTKEEFPVAVFGGFRAFGFESVAPNEPRMYGLRLRYHFGS